MHSPFVADVKVRKRAIVHRSKLYYLRDRAGKSARMRERIDLKGEGGEVVPGESTEAAAPKPKPATAST